MTPPLALLLGSPSRIEDTLADRRDLALRILPGIDILDAVHYKLGDQHAGRAPRWHQAAHAVSMLGEDLDGLDISLEGVL